MMPAQSDSFTACRTNSCLSLGEYVVYKYLNCNNGSASFGRGTAPQSREVPGSIPTKVLGKFKVTYSVCPLSVPGFHSASNRNVYQGIFSGVNCGCF
jgi:hypothetical protein